MAEWKRYQVAVHGYGRKMIRRGPCEGLLEWPQHTWATISTRPMGLKAAIELAHAQTQHAVVTRWMSADKVHDNGRAPCIPDGWYSPDAHMASEAKSEGVMVCAGEIR